jgi:glycerol-3-phosphate dehydrogenase
MSHPERLIYAFVRSATERGAVAVNYACAEQFTLSGGRVLAVAIRDGLSGERHKVRARQIVVAAGPWTDSLVDQMAGSGRAPDGPERHALALNLVLGRRLAQVAMGVRSRLSRDDDPVGGGARFLFLAPQQGSTLLGTWYGIADEASTPAALDRGTRMLLQDANAACPELGLTPADIVDRQWGRLPLDPGLTAGLADRPRIRGEGGRGLDNVLAVEPVKFTTARAVAERVVDRVARVAGHDRVACRTHLVPLSGAGPAPAESGERGSA